MSRLFVVVSALLALLSTSVAAAPAGNISAQTAQRMLKERNNVYLLDVRTPGEFQQMHLASAHLIPIDQVMQRIGEIPQARPIIVYCAVGSRSAQVFNFLSRRGYREIYNLDGGIYAWAQSGYPVSKGRP